jgi:hypothetical protein
MAGKKWSDSEVNFIKENYQKMTCGEIGKVLNRTERAVEHLSSKLKLIREPSVGDKFNRLEILEKYFDVKTRKTWAVFKCQCGNTTKQIISKVYKGIIVSCGCWKAEKASERTKIRNFKHGKGTLDYRLFRIWNAMKTRCYNPKFKDFDDYGGRGITICDDWLKDFIKFEEWSLSNGYQDSLSIDRINVNGNYEPNNCRWITMKEQARNRRNNRMDTVKVTAFGETKSVIDWLEDDRCNLKTTTGIIYRVGAGWIPEEAISKPSERKVRLSPF